LVHIQILNNIVTILMHPSQISIFPIASNFAIRRFFKKQNFLVALFGLCMKSSNCDQLLI